MTMLNFTRLSSAARAIGVAQSCIEEACKYANEREQFGQPDRTGADGSGADRQDVGRA